MNKDDLKKENEKLKNIIDELRNNIEEIKNILDKVLNNKEIYYNINVEIINNYDKERINYYILGNINRMKDSNKNIIKEISDIINEKEISKKFDYLMNIYGNINYEYKTEIYENLGKYIGHFKNGKIEGKGIFYFNDGRKYDGEWKDDKKEGNGIFYWNDGNKYDGEWKDGKKEGKGIFYYNNGNKYEGIWENDKYVKNCYLF